MREYLYDGGERDEYPTNVVEPVVDEFGCGFCWDKKRKKNKDLYFLDAANNMRVCVYCPSCGRELNEE